MADDINKLLAELFAQQQQQVPPGNPIADYLGQRGRDQDTTSLAKLALGAGLAGGGAMTAVHPILSAVLFGGSSLANFSGMADRGRALNSYDGADMWANRFGANDGRQGLPGTPSGPAVRRK